jgi:hypothetical protein
MAFIAIVIKPGSRPQALHLRPGFQNNSFKYFENFSTTIFRLFITGEGID